MCVFHWWVRWEGCETKREQNFSANGCKLATDVRSLTRNWLVHGRFLKKKKKKKNNQPTNQPTNQPLLDMSATVLKKYNKIDYETQRIRCWCFLPLRNNMQFPAKQSALDTGLCTSSTLRRARELPPLKKTGHPQPTACC